MITHPRADELTEAVGRWIDQIRPQLDPRNAFLARVAANALAAVVREIRQGGAAEAEAVAAMSALLGHEGSHEALTAEFCDRIRAGELTAETPGLLATLRAMADAQLAIDQPGYKPDGSTP